MTIALDENTVGMWFCPTPDGDWLASISKFEDCVKLHYRFRHTVDDKIFDSDDVKNWYSATVKNSELPRLIDATRLIAMSLSVLADKKFVELMREGKTMEQFIESFQELPFTHFKKVD